MKIRNSKGSNLIYAAIGFLTITILFIKSYNEINSDKNLLTFFIFFCSFLGAISIYFIFKAYNKKPIYEIDDKKIFVSKNNLTYEFKSLSFYRHEKFISGGYGIFEYLYFYDLNKTLIFKICLTGIDYSSEQVINKIKNKLKVYK